MENEEKDLVAEILEYVKGATLKGSVEFNADGFMWKLGDVNLQFKFDGKDTSVEYFHHNLNRDIGYVHTATSEIMKMIEDINDENNRVHISVSLFNLVTSFKIEKQTDKKKISHLFVRHYYSL